MIWFSFFLHMKASLRWWSVLHSFQHKGVARPPIFGQHCKICSWPDSFFKSHERSWAGQTCLAICSISANCTSMFLWTVFLTYCKLYFSDIVLFGFFGRFIFQVSLERQCHLDLVIFPAVSHCQLLDGMNENSNDEDRVSNEEAIRDGTENEVHLSPSWNDISFARRKKRRQNFFPTRPRNRS